jgi:SAM-dependent methyltransferase
MVETPPYKEMPASTPDTPPPERIVLHVGCGHLNPAKLHKTFHAPGWREVRLDIDPAVKPDIVSSMTNMPMVADASVDAVWSSHNLEHLYRHEVPVALQEFCRVLRPGGFLIMMVPDLQKAAELVLADQLDEVAYTSRAGPITPLDILYGYHRAIARGNTFMAHRTGFTATTLQKALSQAGFKSVKTIRDRFDLWAKAKKPSL